MALRATPSTGQYRKPYNAHKVKRPAKVPGVLFKGKTGEIRKDYAAAVTPDSALPDLGVSPLEAGGSLPDLGGRGGFPAIISAI